MQSIHLFGEYYIIEQENENLVLLTVEQFQIVDLYTQGFSIEKIIETLLEGYEYSQEQFNIIKENLSKLLSTLKKINFKLETERCLTGELEKYYPRVINLELTDKCNLKCSHCYKEANNLNYNYLDFKILDYIYENFDHKARLMHLTGGEPLLHPKFNEIVNKLSEKFLVNVTTNGTLIPLLDRKIINKINLFQISLYGYNIDSFKTITSNEKLFNNQIEALEILEEMKKAYSISITINRLFLENYDKYFSILEKFNPQKVLLGICSITGRAIDCKDFWYVSEEEYKELLKNIKLKNYHLNISIDEDPNNKITFNNDYIPLCGAGSLMYTINEKGKLIYCMSLNDEIFTIGNYDSLLQRVDKLNYDFEKCIDRYTSSDKKRSSICPLIQE